MGYFVTTVIVVVVGAAARSSGATRARREDPRIKPQPRALDADRQADWLPCSSPKSSQAQQHLPELPAPPGRDDHRVDASRHERLARGSCALRYGRQRV